MKRSLLMIAALVALPRLAHAQAPFEASPAEEPEATTPAPVITVTDMSPRTPAAVPAKGKIKAPVGLRLDGGWSPRTLIALPVEGADGEPHVGAQPSRHVAFWGSTRLFLGSTANGLDVASFRFGGEIDAVVDRFRIGGGLHAFVVGISRATRDNTIFSWGPAVFAAARFDLLKEDTYAIFARAAVDAGVEIYNSSAFWGPTLGAGVDFDIGGSRASLK